MKYGIIKKNITDLRARPDSHSERKSQLVFNEPVKIENNRHGYYRIIQMDGYHGWISEHAVKTMSASRLKEYLADCKYRVWSKTAKIIKSKRYAQSLPDFIFYGTNVASVRVDGNYRILQDFDGNRFKILKNNLKLVKKTVTPKTSVIIKEAKRFLGVPYLWGGIGPFGFDCSGFVRTLFRLQNIELSRDSRDQFKCGQKIKPEDVKPADLLFFKGHVALAIGKDLIIHASLREGCVAINSLDPNAINFRKDLADTYLGARRILP